MNSLLTLTITGLALAVRAGVLVGPVINPANGHGYYLLSQNTWSNAEAEAVSLGGHLATIRNAQEDRWVYSMFCGQGGALWIGLTDRQNAFQFTWVSGEPVSYTNWSGGQPDNGTDGIEFYGHIWPRGHTHPAQWNDYANADTVLGFPLYGVAEILPATEVNAPGAGRVFPSSASRRSPDGKWELTCKSADDREAGHSLWLKKARRPGYELHRFGRGCDALWSPDSCRIAVTDWWVGDRADVFIYSVAGRVSKRSVAKLFPKTAIPQKELSGHCYFEARKWLDSDRLQIKISGHTDEAPAYGFAHEFIFDLASGRFMDVKKKTEPAGAAP